MFPLETRILVCDDSAPNRQVAKDALIDLGFTNIIEASNGQLALNRLLDAGGGSFGLVISDWNMPEMKGIELLKKVRSLAHTKNIPFILCTSEDKLPEVKAAIQAGVSCYIVKPLQPEALLAKLTIAWKKHNPDS